MIKKCLTIISSLVFTATTGILCPLNTKAIEDTEPVEVVSMRSEYEKHYDNGNGTYTAYIDTAPIHYYENGKWLDIDNTLTQDDNGNYINRNNSMKVTLSPETSISPINAINEAFNNDNQMVSIDYDGYSLSWSLIDTTISDDKSIIKDEPIDISENVTDIETENPETTDIQAVFSDEEVEYVISSEKVYPVSEVSINEQVSAERNIGMNKLNDKISESVSNLNSSVSYNNISEAIDCKVDIQSNSVKETLILENPDNILEEYSYLIQSNGLVAELCEDNSVVFSDGEDTIFTIPTPFMFDSSDDAEDNYNISVSLEETDNAYIYTLSPDMDWLSDDTRVYPVMIDPTIQTNYIDLGFNYNSQASPDTVYYNNYFYIGNETNNNYNAYVNLGINFNNYGSNPTILGAYLYITSLSNSSNSISEIKVNPVISKIDNLSWASCSSYNKNINSASTTFKAGDKNNLGRCTVNITDFIQYAVNNAYTNNSDIGISLWGLKFQQYTGKGTIKFCNDHNSDNRPFYTITYTNSTNYTLPYAPYKYNNVGSYSPVANFENRMNCYDYALQMYCNEKQIPYMVYKAYPGEFGVSSGKSTDKYKINKFLDLKDIYINFNTRYFAKDLSNMAKQIILTEYSNFVEEQMYRDARVINFNITKYSNNEVVKNNKFTLPTSFNENNGRIISMVAYEVSSGASLDVHFYLRNGNGTCPNGHGGTCSMWSHKPGTGKVINSPTSDYKVKLCDSNIQEYCYKNNTMCDTIKTDIKYFYITKDTNIYTSAHGNGQYDECTGTTIF